MTRARCRPVKCSAVISDVDGTLVTNEKVLTERTRAAAAALRANGILFSLISSRPPRGLRMLIAPLGITTDVGSAPRAPSTMHEPFLPFRIERKQLLGMRYAAQGVSSH